MSLSDGFTSISKICKSWLVQTNASFPSSLSHYPSSWQTDRSHRISWNLLGNVWIFSLMQYFYWVCLHFSILLWSRGKIPTDTVLCAPLPDVHAASTDLIRAPQWPCLWVSSFQLGFKFWPQTRKLGMPEVIQFIHRSNMIHVFLDVMPISKIYVATPTRNCETKINFFKPLKIKVKDKLFWKKYPTIFLISL